MTTVTSREHLLAPPPLPLPQVTRSSAGKVALLLVLLLLPTPRLSTLGSRLLQRGVALRQPQRRRFVLGPHVLSARLPIVQRMARGVMMVVGI